MRRGEAGAERRRVGRGERAGLRLGPAVAAVTQKKSPNDTTQRRAFEYLPMACLSNPLVANNSFAFLQDKKVIGVRVQKALLQASRSREIYASYLRGAAQTDS